MLQAVSAFCESENIKDVDKFMYLCFKQGFDIKRYGLLGETLNEGEKDLIIDENSGNKGGIHEKRVEIPVEVIKEVIVEKEIIKEVPVEVVKEVEKEIYITNDNQVKELGEKIAKLESDKQEFSTKIGEYEHERQIFSTKMEEMENIFQNEMSKKDKELNELRLSLDILKKDDKTKLLQETLQSLRKEIQQKNEKIKELETINRDFLGSNQNQAYLLRGSNLKDRI